MGRPSGVDMAYSCLCPVDDLHPPGIYSEVLDMDWLMTSPITRKEADEMRERIEKATLTKRSTIHELEAILAEESTPIKILPDGSIRAVCTDLPRVLDELEKLKALTAEILRRDYWLRSANVKAIGPVDVVEANVKRTLEHLRELTEGF